MFSAFKNLLIFVFCFISTILIVELSFNLFACSYLYPVKNATSYGYLLKSNGDVIISLNEYDTRLKTQIMLPFELLKYAILNKNLVLDYNNELKLYGYKNTKGELAIDYLYSNAEEFSKGIAIVSIKSGNKDLYGVINKSNKWVIEPDYDFICPSDRYYIKACLDKNHCGVIDRFGGIVTPMKYSIDKLNDKNINIFDEFCSIGKRNKDKACK